MILLFKVFVIEDAMRRDTAAPSFGAWRSVTCLATRRVIRGILVDAVVDQRVLGRSGRDLGGFSRSVFVAAAGVSRYTCMYVFEIFCQAASY